MTIKVTDSRTEALGADAAALPVGVYDHPLDGAPVLVVEEAGKLRVAEALQKRLLLLALVGDEGSLQALVVAFHLEEAKEGPEAEAGHRI